MASADTTVHNGKSYIHEKDDVFNDQDSAARHANKLRKEYKFIKDVWIEHKDNGTYWVWWTNR